LKKEKKLKIIPSMKLLDLKDLGKEKKKESQKGFLRSGNKHVALLAENGC
jgi:hypothetical protein